jgi:hypothetical protein
LVYNLLDNVAQVSRGLIACPDAGAVPGSFSGGTSAPADVVGRGREGRGIADELAVNVEVGVIFGYRININAQYRAVYKCALWQREVSKAETYPGIGRGNRQRSAGNRNRARAGLAGIIGAGRDL